MKFCNLQVRKFIDFLQKHFYNALPNIIGVKMNCHSVDSGYIQRVLDTAPHLRKELKSELFELKDDEKIKKIFARFRESVYFETSKSHDIDVARSQANEEYPFAWEWYVRKKCKNVANRIYGADPKEDKNPNEFFGTQCHQEVLRQLEKIRSAESKDNLSLSEIYEAFAAKRQEIANITHTLKSDIFGKRREEEESVNPSPIADGIDHYHEIAKNKLFGAIKNATPSLNHRLDGIAHLEDGNRYRVFDLADEEHEGQNFYVVTYLADSGEEELASAFVCERISEKGEVHYPIINRVIFSQAGHIAHLRNSDSSESLSIDFFERLCEEKNCHSIIYHCPSKNIPRFFLKTEALFSKILSHPPGTTNSETLNQIAELHWLLACIMPSNRGNAAISEMTIVTLLLYHRFYVTPYKKGMSGDMEALTSSKREFINRFSSLRRAPLIRPPVEND